MTQNAPDQITAAAICDAIGRARLAKKLGRKVTAISNAATEGVFPSSWYLTVRDLCADAGVECPTSLFSFVTPQADLPLPASPEQDVA